MNELAISIAVNCALGVILLAVLHWKNSGAPLPLSDAEDALSKFTLQFPDARGTAAVSDDRCSALLDLQGGEIGLLQRHGRRWNARLLGSTDISSVRVLGDGTLHLKFADFAWPGARIRLVEADSRAWWSSRLAANAKGDRGLGLRDA